MTPVQFAQTWEAHQQTRTSQRRYQQLADELAMEAHIQPEAKHLVSILGKSGDRTNLDALATWIACELAKLDLSGIDVFNYLYARLAMTLDV